MLSYRFEFQCTNNTAEYEALIQGLYKVIGLNVKYFQVYADSKIVIIGNKCNPLCVWASQTLSIPSP